MPPNPQQGKCSSCGKSSMSDPCQACQKGRIVATVIVAAVMYVALRYIRGLRKRTKLLRAYAAAEKARIEFAREVVLALVEVGKYVDTGQEGAMLDFKFYMQVADYNQP